MEDCTCVWRGDGLVCRKRDYEPLMAERGFAGVRCRAEVEDSGVSAAGPVEEPRLAGHEWRILKGLLHGLHGQTQAQGLSEPKAPPDEMEVRDWFAAYALMGIVAHSGAPGDNKLRDVAVRAYELADAMMEERAQVKGKP